MKSPKDMAIIEIEITNACIHKCSNCTRFCGHHKRPFFMDFETFKKAVDSLEGFEGTVSLMGGEPTLHPEFDRFAEYLHAKLPSKKKAFEGDFIFPQKNFMEARGLKNICNMSLLPIATGKTKTAVNGAGTFSAMPSTFLKYYESIQDNLSFQGLNDHTKPMYHQPILISRKALGIDDVTWKKCRDTCWINQKWSASITPKGAFFCEIAGALDILFNGPGGWPIEPGWWKREEKDFGGQLEWCETCGLALHTFSRNANEEIDDISPDIYDKLRKTSSQKTLNILQIQNGKINSASIQNASQYHGAHYAKSFQDRFTKEKSPLYPKGFEVVKIDSTKNFGKALSTALKKSPDGFYIVLCSGKRQFDDSLQRRWKGYVINPGTLHITVDSDESWILLFHKYALSLKHISIDSVKRMTNPTDLQRIWQPKKVIDFDSALYHKNSIPEINKNFRYVLYGTGNNGELIVKEFLRQGIAISAVIDSDPQKYGLMFEGIKVETPKFLTTHKSEYDKIFIASTDYYAEIKEIIQEYGIQDNLISNRDKKFWDS